MRAIIKLIFNLLWLHRDEEFVLREQYGAAKPGTYVRALIIPAPGPLIPVALALVSTAMIFAVLAFGVQQLAPGLWRAAFWPSVVLGCNSALRGGMKYRERMARQAEWDKPVARERTAVRIVSAGIGLAAGLAAALLLVRALRPSLSDTTSITIFATLGLIECARNASRIGGTFPISQFDAEKYTSVFRVEDKGRT